MVKADYIPYTLRFKNPAGTSRGVLREKESWFIRIFDPGSAGKLGTGKHSITPGSAEKVGSGKHSNAPGSAGKLGSGKHSSAPGSAGKLGTGKHSSTPGSQGKVGIGECSIIPGLSPDDRSRIPEILDEICGLISSSAPSGLLQAARDLCAGFPAVFFALETALKDFETGGRQVLFPSSFTEGKEGIPINGLIWMGDREDMVKQVALKLEAGFSVLKLKVGAIEFEEELSVLKNIRNTFTERDLEIRLDANGAWEPALALEKLEKLAQYRIHSLEQPIPPRRATEMEKPGRSAPVSPGRFEEMEKPGRSARVTPGRFEEMARICSDSPIPIALDEELIDARVPKQELLQTIQPSYIILKPSLLGGFAASQEWIDTAEALDIGWWITSALESNVGLNAIAQWTASLDIKRPQGLGTGGLFTNNIPSPLEVSGDKLFHLEDQLWDLSMIES